MVSDDMHPKMTGDEMIMKDLFHFHMTLERDKKGEILF